MQQQDVYAPTYRGTRQNSLPVSMWFGHVETQRHRLSERCVRFVRNQAIEEAVLSSTYPPSFVID